MIEKTLKDGVQQLLAGEVRNKDGTPLLPREGAMDRIAAKAKEAGVDPYRESLLANYVSDPANDGEYVLNLNPEETRELWGKVDAMAAREVALRARVANLEGENQELVLKCELLEGEITEDGYGD